MSRKIYRMISWGGIGDVLLSTPALAALKEQDPDCRIIVFCSSKIHRDILTYNPAIDVLRSISPYANPYSFALYYFKLAHFHICNYGSDLPSLFSRKSAAESVADIFNVPLTNKRIRVYLTDQERAHARKVMSGFKNPIILHISSRTSKNQEWPIENWEQLIKKMPEFTFIQLGVSTEPQVQGAIDLRGKTPFRDAMALVEQALSFVGVDSSFSHVTNAFNIPGVVLFGPSNPEVWGQANNINLYKKWHCAPCIDLLLSSKCPYSKPCMTNISVEEVKNGLIRQINSSKLRKTTPIALEHEADALQ